MSANTKPKRRICQKQTKLDESDLDDEDLAKVAVEAIESWLDEDVVGFEPDEGYSFLFACIRL